MKVLIVEDDKASRLFLESLLESNNYTFKSAANGVEGLNVFEEYEPDLVLTDIQMPIMDGLELLEAIRNKKSETIVIIITAFGTENYAIQALHLGANNYLKKPVSGQELLALLKKYKTIITAKYSPDKLPGKLIHRKAKYEFESDMTKIPKIVDKVIVESALEVEDNIKVNLELGLVELITNAIEHGNLGIDYNEKQEALKKGILDDLYSKRTNNPQYSNRKVIVEFYADSEKFEWTITDEGDGFDWTLLPNPTDQDHILELSGRGIFITRFLFDTLEYKGKGNIVTATKYLKNI
jgi:CheY-like chemotaxis protein/anti-sigma regulatory factor (Ser/Thr protein kinase)